MKILGFGDFLIHFSPMGDARFDQADLMQISFTGAEANVCAALGLWGIPTAFVTRLPDHALARRGLRFLKGFDVDVAHVPFSHGRMGAYYLENGRSLRPSSVIYDRDGSAFTTSRYEDYDWNAILDRTDVVYLSGITPFLSETLAASCLSLLKEAKARGKRIFLDLNYRPTLGSAESFSSVIKPLLPYVFCLIGNEEHIKLTLGVSSHHGEEEARLRLRDIAEKASAATGIRRIAVTLRRTLSADEMRIGSAYLCENEFLFEELRRVPVVDRVGSGDAFSAGMLYGFAKGLSPKDTLSFAAASCALKHTVMSDVNFSTVDEILALTRKECKDVRR